MNKEELFLKIVDKVIPPVGDTAVFLSICQILNNHVWVPQRQRDENRIADARTLIYDIYDANGWIYDAASWNYYIPTLFEVMVALALRMEYPDLHCVQKGDRTWMWFHFMLLSLVGDDNATYDQILNEINFRAMSYVSSDCAPDGRYSLFYIPGFDGDLRLVELWMQKDAWIVARGIE